MDKLTVNKLRRRYNKLEDINDHTGAAKLLVDNFGTESEKEIMNAILARHLRLGYLTSEDNRLRYETSQKYYHLLRNLK